MDSVAIRLAKACEIAEVNDREGLAEKVDISVNTINDWAKKGKNISAKGARQIANAVGMSYEYLLTGTGSPYLTQSGVSDYNHEDRVEEMIKMYKEISDEDRRIIYQMTKRCWLTRPPMEF